MSPHAGLELLFGGLVAGRCMRAHPSATLRHRVSLVPLRCGALEHGRILEIVFFAGYLVVKRDVLTLALETSNQ